VCMWVHVSCTIHVCMCVCVRACTCVHVCTVYASTGGYTQMCMCMLMHTRTRACFLFVFCRVWLHVLIVCLLQYLHAKLCAWACAAPILLTARAMPAPCAHPALCTPCLVNTLSCAYPALCTPCLVHSLSCAHGLLCLALLAYAHKVRSAPVEVRKKNRRYTHMRTHAHARVHTHAHAHPRKQARTPTRTWRPGACRRSP